MFYLSTEAVTHFNKVIQFNNWDVKTSRCLGDN